MRIALVRGFRIIPASAAAGMEGHRSARIECWAFPSLCYHISKARTKLNIRSGRRAPTMKDEGGEV